MRFRTEMPLEDQLKSFFAVAEEAGKKPTHQGSVKEARDGIELRAASAPKLPTLPRVEDVTLEVAGGYDLPARIYEPVQIDRTIIYFHGGGWVSGSVNSFDRVTRNLAKDTKSRVVSVDYRLAPEHPFPVGLNDAREALRWAVKKYQSNGPVVVAGDSAGGNLAAVLAQECRDSGVALAAQILIYPVVDANFNRDSHNEFSSVNYLLNARDLEWYWEHYAPTGEIDRDDPQLAPMNGLLQGLPPTIVVVAGHDPLRDSVLEYSSALQAAGVHTVRLDYDTASHGFISLLEISPSAQAVYADIASALQRLGV